MATSSGGGGGSRGGHAAAAGALGVAHSVLNALADSGLNVDERQRVCAGVLHALAQPSQAAAGVPEADSSLLDIEEVQQRVEASWLVLHEQLRDSAPTINDAVALEVCLRRIECHGPTLPRSSYMQGCQFVDRSLNDALQFNTYADPALD